MPTENALSSLRKKRGVVKRSITRLVNSLRTIEGAPVTPKVVDQAKQLITQLQGFDKDFRSIHFDVIDLLEEGSEDFEKEHDALDKHEDDISDISLRLQNLITPVVTADRSGEKQLSRKIVRVERRLEATRDALALIDHDHDEVPLLQQHQELMVDVKKDLSSIYEELITLDIPDDHALVVQHAGLEKLHFDCSHNIRKLLGSHASRSKKDKPTVTDKASKLPKLDVPNFDGDVIHWQQFWEQFETSVHSRTGLTNAEKLVYLQQAIRSGSARSAIEGLSHSGDQYDEAIDCLKMRYNRPRLIHRAHVRTIMDTPPLKDSSGKELRRLHDTLQQHLRALKSMKSEPDPSFITSVIELKLDETTLFEWQKHSQEKVEEVPHFQDLLDFLNLRAQASESLAGSSKKQGGPLAKKFGKVTSFAAANAETNTSSRNCIICTSERHPLYVCPRFRAMSHEDKVAALKKSNLCLNCFGSSHYVKQCKSPHRCKTCQRRHHSLLHIEAHEDTDTASAQPPRSPPAQVISNAAIKLKTSSLLMTCRVLIFSSDGSSVEVCALLDNGSTSSFVSEHLVQSLRLPRSQHHVHVSGIAGSLTNSSALSVANFQISSTHSDRKIDMTAVVLPKVTCDLPVSRVPFDLSWTHLSGLPLADRSFGEPQRIDILLGVEVFVDVLRQGRRTGPAGSPIAVETELGWVLCGGNTTSRGEVNLHITSHHASTVCSDDLLRRFWEIEESPADLPTYTLEERSVVQHFEKSHSRTEAGRFLVPLPKKPDAKPIGESRTQAVRRFFALERSLHHKDSFREVDEVMQEYLKLGHAEAVPVEDTICLCTLSTRVLVPPRRLGQFLMHLRSPLT